MNSNDFEISMFGNLIFLSKNSSQSNKWNEIHKWMNHWFEAINKLLHAKYREGAYAKKSKSFDSCNAKKKLIQITPENLSQIENHILQKKSSINDQTWIMQIQCTLFNNSIPNQIFKWISNNSIVFFWKWITSRMEVYILHFALSGIILFFNFRFVFQSKHNHCE